MLSAIWRIASGAFGLVEAIGHLPFGPGDGVGRGAGFGLEIDVD